MNTLIWSSPICPHILIHHFHPPISNEHVSLSLSPPFKLIIHMKQHIKTFLQHTTHPATSRRPLLSLCHSYYTRWRWCSLPGFNRLRMHTQLKALPTEHHQPNSAIQQLATAGQQGTIMMTKSTVNINHQKPVAFVEFSDAQSAGQAMQLLQGKYLLSSDRGAMRIEYAKSSFPYHYPVASAAAMLNGRSHY